MNILQTDVVYDKETNRIVAIRYDDTWVLPNTLSVAQFRNGSEPVLIIKEETGELFFKKNALILKGGIDNDSI